jgi:predicted ATPase
VKTSRSRNFVTAIEIVEDRVPSWEEFPFNLAAVRALDGLQFRSPVTFLVGENGVGKSTLLEAIAIAFGFNAEGGSRNFNFSSRESHPALHAAVRLIKSPQNPSDGFFLRAETFYNVASEVERLGAVRGYGDRSLHELSHGESFVSLTMNRFWGDGLYILDEPEAALHQRGSWPFSCDCANSLPVDHSSSLQHTLRSLWPILKQWFSKSTTLVFGKCHIQKQNTTLLRSGSSKIQNGCWRSFSEVTPNS